MRAQTKYDAFFLIIPWYNGQAIKQIISTELTI